MIELLVVIAIIAILAGLLLPALAKASRRPTRPTASTTTNRSVAGKMYTADGDDKNVVIPVHPLLKVFPWYELLDPRLNSTNIFICPSRKENR